LLDAAALEFGARGFHEASIMEITRRAGVALGTFYVYFDSKESIFRALVSYMGHLTREWIAERVAAVPDRLTAERVGLEAFIDFARSHKDLYRIVMEAQFVAPDAYTGYYSSFAEAYRRNLDSAQSKGGLRPGDNEVRAWALIGMSVFLGLRYGIWDDTGRIADIGAATEDLLRHGLQP
jgi:AcrR family transcriptional regulator